MIEMLVDPAGTCLYSSTSIEVGTQGKIQNGNGQYEYLLEACDLCEADTYSYGRGGVAVSDFTTPHFYDPIVTPGLRVGYRRRNNASAKSRDRTNSRCTIEQHKELQSRSESP